MKFTILKLTALGAVAASGVHAFDLPFLLRGSTDAAEEKGFVAESNTCGHKCKEDADCLNGGFVQCGTCYTEYEGTRDFETCIESPVLAPPPSNTCGSKCKEDADCFHGGFVQCGTCYTEYEGTRDYETCIESPRPAPTPPYDPFPDAGMCRKHCHHDRDCKSRYEGTWNPCTKCGHHYGETHHRCYSPEIAEE